MNSEDFVNSVRALPAHPITQVFLVVVTVAALIVAWVSLRRRRLAYCVSGATLASSALSEYAGLAVTYEGEAVDRVTVSDIIVWNQGNDTLPGSQISTTDPLRVELPEGNRILIAEVDRQTSPACAAYLERISDQVRLLRFDYLDPGDGVRLKVVHTGEKPDATRLVGTAQGLRGGPRKTVHPTRPLGPGEALRISTRRLRLPAVLVSAACALSILISIITRTPMPWREFAWWAVVMGLFPFVSVYGVIVVQWVELRLGRRPAPELLQD